MENILIYGAGHYGRKLADACKKYPDIEVAGFVESKPKQSFDKYPVMGMETISMEKKWKDSTFVIAMANTWDAVDVARNLKAIGVKKIYYYLQKENCTSRDFWKGECLSLGNLEDDILPGVEMHIVDFCNLNCRSCTHYSPLFDASYPPPEKSMPASEM